MTLNVLEFGQELVRTGDLDPVYNLLVQSGLPERYLKRFLLAYWCFYHVGVAAAIAEQDNAAQYWRTFRRAYDEKWPRASERRYFRGPKALNAIEYLANEADNGEPAQLVNDMTAADMPDDLRSYNDIRRRVKRFPLFGDWIAFKIADMAERVLGVPVRFDSDDIALYKDPRQGAAFLLYGDYNAPMDKFGVQTALYRIINGLEHLKAPPLYDRPLGVQEAETILCKWKSHTKGRYQVGKDIAEVNHALAWAIERGSSLAEQLKRNWAHGR